GMRTVGDPHLAAVEDVAVALFLRAGAHRGHVRASLGLRHGERSDVLAGNELWQQPALLRRCAIPANLVDAEVGMRPIGQPDGRRGSRYLLHGDTMLDVTEAQASPFLLDRDAVRSKLAKPGPQITRKAVAAVDLLGSRGDIRRRKAAHAL